MLAQYCDSACDNTALDGPSLNSSAMANVVVNVTEVNGQT